MQCGIGGQPDVPIFHIWSRRRTTDSMLEVKYDLLVRLCGVDSERERETIQGYKALATGREVQQNTAEYESTYISKIFKFRQNFQYCTILARY